jgi:predicted small lipoprotein YifL
MNKTSRLLMLVPAACALLVLTACGNKGPLVMPQKPVPIEEQEVVPTDAVQDASDAKSDENQPKSLDNTDDSDVKPANGTDDGNE